MVSTHWNPFSELERFGNNRADIPLVIDRMPQQHFQIDSFVDTCVEGRIHHKPPVVLLESGTKDRHVNLQVLNPDLPIRSKGPRVSLLPRTRTTKLLEDEPVQRINTVRVRGGEV